MAELTQEYVRSILNYDPDTGEWRWRDRPSIRANLNRQCVGKLAGSMLQSGYWRVPINGRNYRAHRLAFLYVTGIWPQNEVDHIDGNKLNNRWSNLREVTHIENQWNRKIPATNTSGLIGAWLEPKTGKWRSGINVPGYGQIKLGTFDTAMAAHSAYMAAVDMFHGAFQRSGIDAR